MEIVDEKVRPERMAKNDRGAKERWWQFLRPRPELYAAIAGLNRVLVISQTSALPSFAFLPADMVYSHKLVIFPIETYAGFAALQSRPHATWAGFFGSTMKDDPVYTPSDCFETFPFPDGWQVDPTLEAAGEAYYDFRATLMVRKDEGLTKTYNRFHDPEEQDADILELRALHAEMDRAVLDAYGWHDIPTDCEFILDYEVEDDESGRKKKPYRYRWPDDVRDEVLARLIELNGERAAVERRAGPSASAKPRGTALVGAAASSQDEELF